MQIGLSLFLIIDALDGFVDANGFVRQRYVLHLQSAEFSDPYTGKQCEEYASGLPVQVHVNALNKSLLLIFGERDHLLDTQLFRVLYQVPVQQRDRPLFVGVLHSKAKYQDIVSVYVLCVAVPTGLHTVSRNSAQRNVKR